MTDKLDDQLKCIAEASVPQGLNVRIMFAVRREARRQSMVIYLLYSGLFSMAFVLFLSIRLFIEDLAGSPMVQLLRLAWTDTQSVFSYFSDWVLAVVESTPVGSLALALGAVFVSILLINRIISVPRVTFRQIKKAV